jgi:hypothetical protein
MMSAREFTGNEWGRWPTIVWYAEASLCGINTEISEFSARSTSEMQSSAHSRDTQGTEQVVFSRVINWLSQTHHHRLM